MSRVRSGQSDHPHKYKNNTGASMPAFGIFRMEGGTRQSTGELTPHGELAAADGEEALFLNSALEIANDKYGNCRTVGDGPFWVRYNPGNAPANGDVVGPVAGETYVDATGSGIVVIFKDTAKGLVLCETIGSSQSLAWFSIESGQVLEECGDSVTARRLGDGVAECLGLFGVMQDVLETGVEVFPCYSWHGVAWGGDLVDISPTCDTGDTILARKVNGEWFAIGSGHVNLFAEANADIADGASGNFTAQVPHGSCVFTCVGGTDDYREKTVAARAVGGDIAIGDAVVLHWGGREWLASKASVSIGCGLAEDGGDIIVDNTVLAGTGLDPEGTCALRVEQAILDDIADLQTAVADIQITLGDVAITLADHETRIDALELCCYENTQAIYECCYGKTEIDVVYSVTCVDGDLVIESKCIYAKTCA